VVDLYLKKKNVFMLAREREHNHPNGF